MTMIHPFAFSPAGQQLLVQCEGPFVAFPYDDEDPEHAPVQPGTTLRGALTVGFGTTGNGVVAGQEWTEPQALARMLSDCAKLVQGINRIVTVDLTDNEGSALCCLAYRVGFTALANTAYSGGTLAMLNAGQFGMMPSRIALWNKANVGGVTRTLPGLVGRCAAEVKLWNLAAGTSIPDFGATRDAASTEFSQEGTMSWV